MVYYQARFSDRPCGMALIFGRERRELGPMFPSTVQLSSHQSSRRYRSYSMKLSHGTSPATRSVRTQSPPLLALNLRVLLSAGYEFLMQHCSHFSGSHLAGHTAAYSSIFVLDQFGDKICIFGFSRGAYTARALAGMIAKVDTHPISSADAPLPSILGRTPPRRQ